MRRIIPLVLLGSAVAALFSGAALAHHSGPENVATGRGAAEATSTNSTPIFGIDCSSIFFCNTVQVGTTTTTTTTSETFDFDASVSSQEATDPLLAEPHGHMKVDLSTTTRRTVTRSQICANPNVFGCPTPSDTSTTQTAVATADVLCLTVVNNRATIGGRVTRFEGNFPPTRGLLVNATDNTIAGQQVTPDRFSAAFVPEAPQVCPAPSADHPITSGDIFVEMN
jgi:hypothetical protein